MSAGVSNFKTHVEYKRWSVMARAEMPKTDGRLRIMPKYATFSSIKVSKSTMNPGITKINKFEDNLSSVSAIVHCL